MQFLEAFLELLFPTPRRCPFCGQKLPKLEICESCLEELQRIKKKEGQCARCGTFGIRGQECTNCYLWPQYFLKNYALIPYKDQWRRAIHQLKFKKQAWLAQPLAKLMASVIETGNFDYIIPIPLHKDRLKVRGFNQSALLGKKISEISGIPILHDVLQRVLATEYQSGLNHHQRSDNVQNAFIITNAELIQDKNILLVDDLITSGATLKESAKLLHREGAKSITGISLGAGVKF